MNQMTLISLDFLVALFTLLYLVKLLFHAVTHDSADYSVSGFQAGLGKRSLRNQRISVVR